MFKLEIDTDNAAFDVNVFREIARLLRVVAVEVDKGADFGQLRDANGNKVGAYRLEGAA